MAFKDAHNFVLKEFNALEYNHQQVLYNIRQGGTDELSPLEKAACLGAGHQSAERFDPPKCHPETRTAVIKDIMSWVTLKDPKERVMWLNGPAGAGKSSIAQTVAEICHNSNRLISSFFFSRTATGTGRDDGNRLIPTIACHLGVAIPATKDFITAQLNRDKGILTYAMDVQMRKLVVEPLEQVIAPLDCDELGTELGPDMIAQTEEPINLGVADLIIIDGLDECKEPKIQSKILKVIAGILSQSPVHLRFLIVSRPELEIRNAFNSEPINGICTRLVLDEWYNPEKDIRTYLQSEFSTIKREHTLSAHLRNDTSWPSSWDIETLVNRSSGQFIYASTIIKFILNDRRDPRERLCAIIDAQPKETEVLGKESPYTELDALYTYILSNAEERAEDYNYIRLIFQVLLFSGLCEISAVTGFIKMRQIDLELFLVDLHSLIFIPPQEATYPQDRIRFFHASFGEFLKDPSRSGRYLIAEDKAHISLGHYCLARILDCQSFSFSEKIRHFQYQYSQEAYLHHCKDSNFDDELLDELRSKDVHSVLQSIVRTTYTTDPVILDHNLLLLFKVSLSTERNIHFTPVTERIQDICNCMSTVVDEFLLADYYNITEEWSLYPIIEVMKVRSASKLERSIIRCWRAEFLDNPQRSKHLFLSSRTSQELFRSLFLGNVNVTNYLASNEFEAWLPFILEYLLCRIIPSREFVIFLQEFIQDFDNLLVTVRNFERAALNTLSMESTLTMAGDLRNSIAIYLQECEVAINSQGPGTLVDVKRNPPNSVLGRAFATLKWFPKTFIRRRQK